MLIFNAIKNWQVTLMKHVHLVDRLCSVVGLAKRFKGDSWLCRAIIFVPGLSYQHWRRVSCGLAWRFQWESE